MGTVAEKTVILEIKNNDMLKYFTKMKGLAVV